MTAFMSNTSTAIDRLQRTLGYRFHNPEHLVQALTHRSHGRDNNERLEFLGDAVLSQVMAQHLFEQFPKAREGELSRLRASLVRGATLAELAQDISLGDYLRLGPGEMKSGGYRRESILADCFEAVLGAILLDAGYDTCRERILAFFDERLAVLDPGLAKDPKTRLQEYLQARGCALPVYSLCEVVGKIGRAHV